MQPANKPSILTSFAHTGPYLLVTACLAVVAVFVLLGQYAHPSSDDFCMAAGVNQYGLITHLWNHYFEWSGRYSANALYAIYPVVSGLFAGYRFIPAIMLAGLLLATAFFLSTLLHSRMLARSVMLSSLCFVSVYLLGMMSPASSLFWMAGALTYQTANILFFVSLGLMIRLDERQKRSQHYFAFVAVLLGVLVIAMGTNETSMLALTAVSMLGFVVHLRTGWARLKPWLVILVMVLICFAVVYFSPGNTIRAADFPLRHDLSRAINGSLVVGFKVLWIWLSSPVLIVSSVLVPFALAGLNKVSGRSITVSNTQLVLLGLCTFALPVMLQFPAWWSMGGWPPARTLDAIYFLFLVSWFMTIGAITLRFSAKQQSYATKQSLSAYPAITVIVLSLIFTWAVLESPSMLRVKNDLFHVAGPWHEYMIKRYVQIKQAVAEGQLYLTVADYQQEYPRSLYFNDIMHNPQHWRNVCYADYFGLEIIKRDKPESSIDVKAE